MKKRSLLLALLLCCTLLLTGCACKHEQTEVRDMSDPTCTVDGYTGDTYCLECDEKIAEGEAIPALGHTEGELTGATEPACTTEGYTGDVPCTVCGELLSTGEAIPATGHTEAPITNDFVPSCTVDGYTGDVRCAVCADILTWGEAIPATGHDDGEVIGALDATCWSEGYTGDTCCTVCYETLKIGEVVAKLPHTPGEPTDVAQPFCTAEGYTGDSYCTICGELVEKGEAIPAAGHVPGDPVGAIEPTCQSTGYTGDTPCTVCGEVLRGTEIPTSDHDYIDDTCAICNYRVAGLYIDNTLTLTWQQLIDGNYIAESDNCITSLAKTLYGELYIRDGITSASPDVFCNIALNIVNLPASFTSIPSFSDSAALTNVHYFSDSITEIGSFSGCKSLISFIVPHGITEINGTFSGCTSLTEVILPDTLVKIGQNTFYKCSALKTLNIPDSVETIGKNSTLNMVFSYSGIEELILPANLTDYSADMYFDSIQCLDYSKCVNITDFSFFAEETENLRQIVFPPNMKTCSLGFKDSQTPLSHIDLPDTVQSVKNIAFYPLKKVTSIVWPVSLMDGSSVQEIVSPKSLATIYYCGSELQWNLMGGSAFFPNAEVIFDYVRE